MALLGDFFSPRARLLQQEREIVQLRKEVATLLSQNASMRDGMRRCVTCEYRIDYKNRQGQAPVEDNSNNSIKTNNPN